MKTPKIQHIREHLGNHPRILLPFAGEWNSGMLETLEFDDRLLTYGLSLC